MSQSDHPGLAPAGASRLRSGLYPRVILLLLAGYFALSLCLRLWVSDSAELDESEQLVLTQEWRWGYGSQPPLYTWMLSPVFSILGVNLFSLALLKAVLLFSTCLMTFLAGRELSGDDRAGWVGMFSLAFLPQFVWESQRDLTHSVMATTFTAATVWIIARLGRTRGTTEYAALGLAAGCGLLGKYNYGVFLAALVFAMAWTPEWRPALRDGRIFLSLALCALCVAPHVCWAWLHPADLLQNATKLHAREAGGLFDAWLKGLGSLAQAVAAYVIPLALAHSIAWRGMSQMNRDVRMDRVRASARLLTRLLIVAGVVCIVLVFVFSARFKDRWMQPLLYVLPLLAALQILPRLSEQRWRRLAGLSAFVALVVLVVLPGRHVIAELTRAPQRLNRPYRELAEQLRARGVQPALILAENRLLAGNLRLFFPGSEVSSPDAFAFAPKSNGATLVVWHAADDQPPPAGMADWIAELGFGMASFGNSHFVEAPLKYYRRESLKLWYVYLPAE